MNQKRLRLVAVCLVLVTMVMGCAGPAPAPSGPSAPNASQNSSPQAVKPNYTPGPDEPHIFFMEPLDGDSVSTSTTVRFGVSRLDLSGKRIYLIIDRPCAAPGDTLTVDEQHMLYSPGRSDLSVDLSAGPHRLCLQTTDNKGVALNGPGMLQVIDITAE